MLTQKIVNMETFQLHPRDGSAVSAADSTFVQAMALSLHSIRGSYADSNVVQKMALQSVNSVASSKSQDHHHHQLGSRLQASYN